jgi:hypothetical protein
MRSAAFAAILASSTVLSGCAGTVAGVSLSSISSFAGFASTLFTGADLGEHAASLVTGKDCRFSEGLMRADRQICEENGSPATRKDFHGIFVERVDEDGNVIYAAPKYMSASVGAGENENNPDVIWAQIKEQKSREENERQLARADRNQQIDVAALANGTLSPTALGFLPVGFSASASTIDEEPASQTAARPRDFKNTAQTIASRPSDNTAPAPHPVDADQPALDEKTFTASMQIANATGEGGPFIAAATNSTPVVSTLVNGEPVVVMRIGPMINSIAMSAPSEHAAPAPEAEAPRHVAQAEPIESEPASPQALVSALPKRTSKPAALDLPEEDVAPVEPPKPAAKPKQKPVQVAANATPKPVKAKPAAPAPSIPVEEDVYTPPANDAFNSPAPDLTSAPAAAPKSDEPAPSPATSAPAPLIPMAQP